MIYQLLIAGLFMLNLGFCLKTKHWFSVFTLGWVAHCLFLALV